MTVMTTIMRKTTSEAAGSGPAPAEPERFCELCPRLTAFRAENRAKHPDWFNGAAPSFGDCDARLLIVGLAPGLQGANRTGRPFTGDYAGDLLYATLAAFGFSQGDYAARPDDGLVLRDAMITNAVRCVPPENKPTGGEIATCRPHLSARIAALPQLAAILCLGKIAHDSTIRALGLKAAAAAFGHGARYRIGGVTLFDSYHCSRYNTQTKRLTPDMFRAVFAEIRELLDTG